MLSITSSNPISLLQNKGKANMPCKIVMLHNLICDGIIWTIFQHPDHHANTILTFSEHKDKRPICLARWWCSSWGSAEIRLASSSGKSSARSMVSAQKAFCRFERQKAKSQCISSFTDDFLSHSGACDWGNWQEGCVLLSGRRWALYPKVYQRIYQRIFWSWNVVVRGQFKKKVSLN